MTIAAIITLVIILIAIILFATEIISIDLVAILIMVSLILTGVLTPEEGVRGFSNTATLTVAFMFILSEAILKTGALQFVAYRLADIFRTRFNLGMLLMMLLIAFISAFVNNTPVVAVFIPVVIQIAHASGHSPAKLLIPLSFASIFGGMCTLVGTSTNILVSGILEKEGLNPLDMFQMAPMGLILFVVGILYMMTIGKKLLPKRKIEDDLSSKFGVKDYLMDIELLENSASAGKRIMDADLVKEYDMDIIEVRRNGSRFTLPQGDFKLKKGDLLKVKCNVEKIKSLKDKSRISVTPSLKVGEDNLLGKNSALVEMVITSKSELDGKTLKSADFRRRFRAIPLAVKHRDEIIHEDLYNVPLKSGDVILAEVKKHFIIELKKLEAQHDSPFVILSEDYVTDFNKKRFYLVMSVIIGVILLATFNVLNIMVAAITGVALLVLSKCISMKESYDAVNWNIVFLLAGALSLGTAMKVTGLDQNFAHFIVNQLGQWGPYALISGLYIATSLLTEVMSNNATAALLAPIAIAIANSLGLDYMPFIMTITFAASASFMTPVGYQTNTMVYSAGQYKFRDFTKIGIGLNLIFWILASIFIPIIYDM